MEDLGKTVGLLFAGAILIAVIIVTIALIFGAARTPLLDLEREGNQRSQQYVETTREHLFQLKRKYDDLQADIIRLSTDESNQAIIQGMKARQESLLDEMAEEANSIPLSEVPEGVKELLEQEGRWQQ